MNLIQILNDLQALQIFRMFHGKSCIYIQLKTVPSIRDARPSNENTLKSLEIKPRPKLIVQILVQIWLQAHPLITPAFQLFGSSIEVHFCRGVFVSVREHFLLYLLLILLSLRPNIVLYN